MLRAGDLSHLDVLVALEKVDGFQIAAIHGMDLTRGQSVGARRHVLDCQDLRRVEVAATLLPIVLVTLELGIHAGLVSLELHCARADAGARVNLAVLRRQDGQVIIRHDVRKVGVATLESEDDDVLAVGLDVLDLVDDAFRRRLRVFAAMVVVGGDDVLCFDGLAVVKLDTLSQLDRPYLGVRRRLYGLGELGDRFALGVDLHQEAVNAVADSLHVAVGIRCRVERVRRRSRADTPFEVTAPLWRRGKGRTADQRRHRRPKA